MGCEMNRGALSVGFLIGALLFWLSTSLSSCVQEVSSTIDGKGNQIMSLVSGVNLPPSGKVVWDWQIGGTDTTITVPVGTQLLDVDGFNISAAKISSLKAQGIYAVCYIDAGSYESGRPDSSLYPAYLKFYKDVQWNEWFLDVRDVFKPILPVGTQLVNNKWVDANGVALVGKPTQGALAPLLTARLKMCKDKGFDALEPDNLQNDENTPGLLTKQEQVDFDGWLADLAHSMGLAIFQKNAPGDILLKDRTGVMLVDKFDGILNEQCQRYNECAPLKEYSSRGKLALDVEYKKSLTLNCSSFNNLGVNALKKDLNLVGGKSSGYKRITCP